MNVCSDDGEKVARRSGARRALEFGWNVPDTAECDILQVDSEAVARARESAPDERSIKRLSDIFSALADPTRVRILQALSAEDLCVCDIAAVAGVSQSAASHQLRLLRDRDLVAFTRDGKRAVYRLADEHVRLLLEQGLAHAAEAR